LIAIIIKFSVIDFLGQLCTWNSWWLFNNHNHNITDLFNINWQPFCQNKCSKSGSVLFDIFIVQKTLVINGLTITDKSFCRLQKAFIVNKNLFLFCYLKV